ncbi:carbohydrate kinase family protein [Williamsia herbipolensis]|uniref:carbohydrate kinase family protein n=1 Tax=Williamsia herbipolensis TaxID=1603258 RepID=UPI0005F84BB0|nr:carbohydrate kinase [Williamsia herbipolensis]
MKEIVVCGESLVDLVAHTGGLAPLRPALGGGPFNVAVALGRLGSAVSFCSRVSTDHFGDELVASLRAAGVNLSLLQRDPDAPTSLALASLGDDGAASYTFYVEGTADRRVVDPGPLPGTVGALAFGTLSLVLEPGASVYEQMMHTHHAQGRLILLDPNIRTPVIADADAYRRRFLSWLPSVDVVKVSDDDADWLAAGSDGSRPADWLDAGVGAVVTTRGGAGLAVTTGDFTAEVAAPVVVTADTIGAGDTVVGALLHWLGAHGSLGAQAVRDLDREAWQAALSFAARAAAITVSRPGADPPWAGELTSD